MIDSTNKPIVFLATVKSTKDPLGLGRVQVELKSLDKPVEMPWIRMIHGHASKGFGTMLLPEVGDMVAILRGAGDKIGSMYILGSVYDKKNKPAIKDKDGKNNIKQFQTRSKHVFEISDEKGKEKISLKTGKGAEMSFDDKAGKITVKIKGLSIEMDGKGKAITLKSDGDISIKAGGKLTLAGTKGIDIKGKEISMKSDMDTKIKGGMKVAIEGGVAVDIKGGAKVAVKGAITAIG
jgi:uncharacterized protein involved in type VI secretion and phage assembly